MNETKYWVWLSMVFGAANRRLWQLMNICETASEAYHELCSGECSVSLTEKEKKNAGSYTLKNAEDIMMHCERSGIAIAGYDSPDYPPQLRFIPDPPAVLYYRGDISCVIGKRTVVSVGTRHAEEYSINAAWRICSELAAEGIVIVSGFAMGIDITSHMAAAENGHPTACVLGCGIDVDYPKDNRRYREKILNSGGVFISEYPPGTSAFPGNFPKRNRILSALGYCTMVFEASLKSGSMLTAGLTLDNGKDLFVLPPSDIFSGSFVGSSKLLREGAMPLLSAEDVAAVFTKGSRADNIVKADAFYIIKSGSPKGTGGRAENSLLSSLVSSYPNAKVHNTPVGKMPDGLGKAPDKPKKDASSAARSKAAAEEKAPKQGTKKGIDLDSIPEGTQRNVAKLLSEKGRLHADVISAELDIDSTDLMTELTELEILGAVKALPGRMYELV